VEDFFRYITGHDDAHKALMAAADELKKKKDARDAEAAEAAKN
jgi:hypothetical protein